MLYTLYFVPAPTSSAEEMRHLASSPLAVLDLDGLVGSELLPGTRGSLNADEIVAVLVQAGALKPKTRGTREGPDEEGGTDPLPEPKELESSIVLAWK